MLLLVCTPALPLTPEVVGQGAARRVDSRGGGIVDPGGHGSSLGLGRNIGRRGREFALSRECLRFHRRLGCCRLYRRWN
jgi:hypothetical protein